MQPLNLPGTELESGSWSNMLVRVVKTGWGWGGVGAFIVFVLF